MSDPFETHQTSLNSPVEHAFAITPHDTNELSVTPRGILCTADGQAAVIFAEDTAAVSVYLAAGVVYPYRVKVVKATGTTATGIVGIY